MHWHPLKTNPLDHVGASLTGECGSTITIEQNMRGEYTVSAGEPINRRIAGLSNASACYALNTWGARLA